MAVRWGTPNFKTHAHAVKYFSAKCFTYRDVIEKVNNREILIGPPLTWRGQPIAKDRLIVDSDGRYWIKI